ncbi:MAG: hypothetical protein DRJ51_03185 [Thermoprotei archaeon]|nr:MAG: hypothetical protein DRJ51_03185 [Thermoprotei archaeon]RLF01708.1 MAG: hypothetical protein DRJ59_05465 [Thermoprotei archaeon]
MPFKVCTPSFVIWLITARCNLDCKHCYVKDRDWSKELSKKESLKLVDILASHGVRALNITGGEPLLRKDLFEIIDRAIEYDIEVSMFSNLILLNEKIARELARRDIGVFTSIDGARPEVHDTIRGRGTWHRVIEGIRLLKLLGVDVYTSFAVSKYNYFDTGGYARLAVDLDADYISIIPVIPSTPRAKNAMPEPYQVYRAVVEFENSLSELGAYGSVWCAPFAHLYTRGYVRVGLCPAFSTLDISPDGSILLCDTLDIKIGNVLQEDFMDVLLKYQENPLERAPPIPKACSDCPLEEQCGGGCLARRILTGKLKSPDPLCIKAVAQADKVL